MANVCSPCGLRPINRPFGSVRATWYKMVTGASVFIGTPVTLNGNGYMDIASAGSGSLVTGAALGFAGSDWGPISNVYSGYLPANPADTDTTGLVNVLVADDPEQFFLIQESTDTTALVLSSRGAGASFANVNSGSTMSGVSLCVFKNSTVSADSAHQLQLVKELDSPGNAFGNHCKWICRINYHSYKPCSQVSSPI